MSGGEIGKTIGNIVVYVGVFGSAIFNFLL